MKKFSILLVFLLILSGAIIAVYFLKSSPVLPVPAPPASLPIPIGKIPPPAALPPPLPPAKPAAAMASPVRIAIIVDDLGFSAEATRLVLSLQIPFTISVLPFYPYSRKSAEWAQSSGKEVLLHVPMEPIGYPGDTQPGKGVLLSGASPTEIERQIREELSELPSISGVSSHMGSLFTADPEGMRSFFLFLKKQGLFFVDNVTTNKTETKKIAQEVGLKFLLRDVFIDNDLNRDIILKQLGKTEKIAREKGAAIAVGHPHPETISALGDWIPEARSRGITFVRVTELVR